MTRNPVLRLLAIGMLAAATGSLVWLSWEDQGTRDERRTRHPAPTPFLLFRTLAPADVHGRVAWMQLTPDGERGVASLACHRLHYAAGAGLCAVQERAGSAVVHAVYTFDAAMGRRRRIAIPGIPTRLRVSPNGRRGAITSYAEEETAAGERLATTSRIVDMATGRVVADLRAFRVDNETSATVAGPVDVASVAFERDGDRFFATVESGGERFLSSGSVGERRLTLLKTGVANEALSPDGRRLILKRLVEPRGIWRLAVMDLGTWEERDLAHPRSVDDQVEWLDADHVIFHDADGDTTSIWMLAVDGTEEARVLTRDAFSAVVQR